MGHLPSPLRFGGHHGSGGGKDVRAQGAQGWRRCCETLRGHGTAVLTDSQKLWLATEARGESTRPTTLSQSLLDSEGMKVRGGYAGVSVESKREELGVGRTKLHCMKLSINIRFYKHFKI